MRFRKFLINLITLGVSAIIGVLLCELGARLVLQPADYLSVEMVPDIALGAVPSTRSRAGGFDDWGFRNRSVPATVDIVAIGDSHTYGNTATMDDSWPYVLGRLSGQSVYNMGLGGYGPNQYFELLQRRALSLKPRTIICGLYMGDDFENAFLITYGLDHWAYLRKLQPGKVNFDIWEAPPALTTQRRIRQWLSRHSVVYQLIVHGSLLGRFEGNRQIAKAAQVSNSATTLVVPEKHILEAFLPEGILRRLDQQSEAVREGMRITFQLLAEMDAIARQNGARFVVAVIPTKEMVFSEYLEHNPKLSQSGVLDSLLANERVAREKTFKFFVDSNITYVDTLPALKRARENEIYARIATDMHPGKNGYHVIGEAVFEALKPPGGKGVEGPR
jgi:hypothetical protein